MIPEYFEHKIHLLEQLDEAFNSLQTAEDAQAWLEAFDAAERNTPLPFLEAVIARVMQRFRQVQSEMRETIQTVMEDV